MSILTTGQKYLEKFPNFELVGRSEELERICSVLLRNKANSIFLTGIDGVGCADICLGLQASKSDPNSPSDVFSKRLFWLDVDELFSNGNNGDLSGEFSKVINELKRAHNSIVIIEDTKDFIESARNTGSLHFLNAISMGIRNNDFQAIFQAKDEEIDAILKTHTDINQLFTFISVDEPVGDNLETIVRTAVKRLSKHHKMRISDDAITTAIELTTKYQTRDAGLSKAQPERTITLIDRALSAYRLNSHKTAPVGFSEADWTIMQNSFRQYYRELRDAEDAITDQEEALQSQFASEKKRANAVDDSPQNLMGETTAVLEIKKKINLYQKEADKFKKKFDDLTAIVNNHLELTKDLILLEFSDISGISVNKLNQNEIEKLKVLEPTLKKRIFGQDEVVNKLSNAVKIARVGGRNKDRPQASFLFLGPSGVGKTEVSKALASLLLDDEKALTRFDMSEYMEKHAVAKLIGAPPGYEGFEAGGILTNLMRKNGNRILLFDEIEKADSSIFNIFLQILSDGRLSDNLGRTASFQDAIIIMTTNIGQDHFLNAELNTEDANALAITELNATYKSEFLNRFAGRQNIVPFKKLDLDSIKKIVSREFFNLNKAYIQKGFEIKISDAELDKFCSSVYDPKIGARGLPGYIEANVEPVIVNELLDNPGTNGIMHVSYDSETLKLNVNLEPAISKAA